MPNYYNNSYVPAGYTPYYQNMQRIPEMYQQYNRQIGLFGKTIENIEVAKTIDIPIDRNNKLFSTC